MTILRAENWDERKKRSKVEMNDLIIPNLTSFKSHQSSVFFFNKFLTACIESNIRFEKRRILW